MDEAPHEFWVYPLQWGETVADQDWFPLKFHALLGSQFAADSCVTGEDGRAAGFTALLLWCEAFKQDPGGTLPDNDVALARLAGYGPDVSAWRRVRERALHGWSRCQIEGDDSDGRVEARLGHRVVAEQALFAWRRKNGRRVGRDAARFAQVKWKVRNQMKLAKRPQRLLDDDMLVSSIARWLVDSGLSVTAENVSSGLARAGVGSVVPLRRDSEI